MKSVNVRRLREWSGLRCVAVLAASLLLTGLLGAVPGAEERKLVHRVEPIYPEIAKRNNITGIVKVRLTIGRDGTVKGAEPVGGHPVLIEALLNAVENWKYAAASKESTVTVEFKFEGAK